MFKNKSNIVLIGMPGAGKSTIGVLLAKSLLKSFCDTDLVIQMREGMSLCEIIEKDGVKGFIQKENDIICSCEFENAVVATGGSAVYGEEAMRSLRKNAIVVYLHVPCEELEKRINNIHTRGVAMENGTTIKELYSQRKALYEKYADVTVDCMGLTAEQCVNIIAEKLNTLYC